MPWENLNIKDMFENYPDIFFKNRRSRGLVFENNDRLSIIKVMYSSKFVENRVSQMKELFDSINSKGLIKDSNLPKINILKNRMSGGGLWVTAATIDHIFYLVLDMSFLVQE